MDSKESSAPLTNFNIIQQPPKSDLKGFTSPRSKQQDFLPVPWNEEMLTSNNPEMETSQHVYEEVIDCLQGTLKQLQKVQPGKNPNDSISVDNLDPTNVSSLWENIFNENSQPVTSTPKPSRPNAEENRSMSSKNSTSIDNETTTSPTAVANVSQENSSTDSTQKKSDDSTSLDETKKPLHKEKKIPDIRFEEILKGNYNYKVVCFQFYKCQLYC